MSNREGAVKVNPFKYLGEICSSNSTNTLIAGGLRVAEKTCDMGFESYKERCENKTREHSDISMFPEGTLASLTKEIKEQREEELQEEVEI